MVLAYLLWEFASGYCDKAESALPITWVFPALGILSQRQLCDAIPLRCATLAQIAGSSLDRTQQLGFLRNLGKRMRRRTQISEKPQITWGLLGFVLHGKKERFS